MCIHYLDTIFPGQGAEPVVLPSHSPVLFWLAFPLWLRMLNISSCTYWAFYYYFWKLLLVCSFIN
jgi:hypothetical protein